MSDADRDSMLAQFRDVTGCENDRAKFFLDSSDWNLELAIGSFYTDPEPMESSSSEAPPPQAPPPQAPPPQAPPLKPPTAAAAKKPPSKPRSGNIATLNNGSSSSSDDDEEEGQAFYAGGSTTSGQQILGPPRKKKTGQAFVKDMFRKAREHGAEAVDPSSPSSSGAKPRSNAFTGVGFKLGSSESGSSERVEGRPGPKPPREFVLKMWKNGFSIDDGGVRPYNSPENRAFLAAVMSGRIPEELVELAEGGEVHVDMEDHKEEEFAQPKGGAQKAFTGAGHVLGGIAPEVVGGASASGSGSGSTAPPPDPDSEKDAQDELRVNDDEPVTSVQVRLPDGKRLVAKVNHSHTIADLRRFVRTARPDYGGFGLHTTFPPAELADDSRTVKEAGLIGAAVLLRLK